TTSGKAFATTSPSTSFANTGPPLVPCLTSSAAWVPAAPLSWSTASTTPPCSPSSPAKCSTPSAATAPNPARSSSPAATTPSHSLPSPISPAIACSPSSSNPSPSGTYFGLCSSEENDTWCPQRCRATTAAPFPEQPQRAGDFLTH